MKTAISIPDATFQAAEALAKRLGVSRSQLYCRAIAQYVEAAERADVTRRLDETYATETSELDPEASTLQWASLPHEGW